MKLAIALFLLSSGNALASMPACPTERDHHRLEHFRDRLARADTPDAARELALAKIAVAERAIDQAERVLPGEPRLEAARARLDGFAAGVASAESQSAVAGEFDSLMLGDGGGCSYDTVEIVVIVIGFILGIIPGIIFLFLFC
jgi:hypothetical protein